MVSTDSPARSASVRWVVRGALAAVIGTLLVAVGVTPAYASVADKRNDYNNDGVTDTVAINPTNYCLYQVDGAYRLIGCGWFPYRDSLAAPGDVDGDGAGDLYAISATDNCIYRWLGNGSGGFGAGVKLNCSGWAAFKGALTGAGDLNGDGRGDLVGINSNDNCMYRWYGTSSGYGTGAKVGCGWGPYRGRVTGIGDIDSDGHADLVGLNSDTDCLLGWPGNGNGTFKPAYQVTCLAMSGYDYLAKLSGSGDWSGDGIGDLVAINALQSCLNVWYGDGTGHFEAPFAQQCDTQIFGYQVAM